MSNWLKKVTKANFLPGKDNARFYVYSKQFNEVVDDVLSLFPTQPPTNSVVGIIVAAAPQFLVGPGAITLTQYKSNIATTGANAYTLADGTVAGQLKKVKMVNYGGDGTLTPVNFAQGTTITFSNVGDEVTLVWNGTEWVLVDTSSLLGTGATPVVA